MEHFLNELYFAPLPAPGALTPSIFTAGQAWRKYIRHSKDLVYSQRAAERILRDLKNPSSWPYLARQLSLAMDGDARSLVDSDTWDRWYFEMERSAVMCNDGPRFAPPTIEELVDEHVDVFLNVSKLAFAALSTEEDPGCQYWPVTPSERFAGPWNHTLGNPVLVISNTVRI